MVGVPVKVIAAPVQLGFAPEVTAMLIVGATVELTDTVIAFEVAVVGLAQAALEVNTQVITSPSAGELKV